MSSDKKPVDLKVSDFMIEKVYFVTPKMTLEEVAEFLLKLKISGAPVVDSSGRVISVMGEGALLRLAASEGLKATVAHCLAKMTGQNEIVTMQKDGTFTDAYRLFLKHNIHRIPIVDSNGLLKGLVTRSSIFRLFVEAHYGRKLPNT